MWLYIAALVTWLANVTEINMWLGTFKSKVIPIHKMSMVMVLKDVDGVQFYTVSGSM